MIDRSYYVEYFLIAAVSGAMSRVRFHGNDDQAVGVYHVDQVHEEGVNAGVPAALAGGSPDRKLSFGGFGFFDACISFALTYATLRFWDYILDAL